MIGKKGKVFVSTTNPDASSVVERVEGFKKGISEYPDIEIVGIEYNLDIHEKPNNKPLCLTSPILTLWAFLVPTSTVRRVRIKQW